MNKATRLECGCVFGDSPLPDGSMAFVYQPCSEDCEYYLYSLKAAAELDKPMRKLDLRGESVQVPGQQCPTCNADLSMATDLSGEGATPKPGDWTICSECAAMLVFGDDLAMRVPTEAELADAPPQLNYVQSRMLERPR